MKKVSFLSFNTFIAFLVISISAILVNDAKAIYIFEWHDFGEEWYTPSNASSPITKEAEIWEGFITLPDTALQWEEDGEAWFDFTQFIDFSLEGILESGESMVATSFTGGDIGTFISPNPGHFNVELGEFEFFAETSSMSTISISKGDQDGLLSYTGSIFNEQTSLWESVSISHNGQFIGHYVPDRPASPVPEPASLILFGSGAICVAASRFRRKRTAKHKEIS